MIAHLVLLKPRPDLSVSDRGAFVASFRRAVATIPTVRGVRIGRRVVHGAGYEKDAPDVADFLAIVEFDDLAGLQAYLQHPAHVELGGLFGEIVGSPGLATWSSAGVQTRPSAVVYDFEVGGLEKIDNFAS